MTECLIPHLIVRYGDTESKDPLFVAYLERRLQKYRRGGADAVTLNIDQLERLINIAKRAGYGTRGRPGQSTHSKDDIQNLIRHFKPMYKQARGSSGKTEVVREFARRGRYSEKRAEDLLKGGK